MAEDQRPVRHHVADIGEQDGEERRPHDVHALQHLPHHAEDEEGDIARDQPAHVGRRL
ncbi:hypothetical protein D3C83_336130 [compost metagenome]